MSVKTILRWALVLALGTLFIYAGAVKAFSFVQPAKHAELAKMSLSWPKTFPLQLVGWNAEQIRTVVGSLEVVFGLLAFCPHYTRLSAFVFVVLMAGATHVHYQLKELDLLPVTAVLTVLSLVLFAVSGAPGPKKANATAQQQKKKQ